MQNILSRLCLKTRPYIFDYILQYECCDVGKIVRFFISVTFWKFFSLNQQTKRIESLVEFGCKQDELNVDESSVC